MATKPPVDDIRDTPLGDTLGEKYLAYALSTIMHRALPDVRDGLKPVHRRILYAMRQLKLDPASGYKKCARIVGDVIGQFHPHGDQAVYDALVRLAQDFSHRFPLIDGQGNFGNIDGDSAAAMRYTESRLTQVAQAMLEGIDEDTVDFRETYDGADEEPIVLPGAFPNLLANGSSGIAVGMATSIPPHNVSEICDAATHLIKHPSSKIEKLVSLMPGPDFPTGGIIVDDQETILNAYKTGRGGFRVRARWQQEDLERGAYVIVITEMPFQVQKGRLIEKIAELIQSRKLTLVGDVRDESAEDVRLIIEPKTRTVDPMLMMEQLFKLTDLETRISLNMNVLDKGQVPRVMNLQEVLQAFLDHRKEVLVRRSRYRLGKIEHRLEVLEGYLIAFLNLDEVIRIIREEDDPKAELIATFELTDVQAEAILNMRLRSLRKLEEMEIKKENRELKKTAKELRALLKSDELQWERITGEIKEIKEAFGKKTANGKRRTSFEDAPDSDDISFEVLQEKEPITVICSEMGWIRTMKGHVETDTDLKFKEGDGPRFFIHAQTTDKLLLFASNGRFYTLNCDRLPGGRGHGEPVRLMVDFGEGEEDVVDLFVHEPGQMLLIASSSGHGFVVKEDDVLASKRSGKQVLNVGDGIAAVACVYADGDHVVVIGDNRKMLVFPLDQVPAMARGRGVALQKYKDGGLSDVAVVTLKEGLEVLTAGGSVRTFTDLKDWVGSRAAAGRLAPKGFPRSNKFS